MNLRDRYNRLSLWNKIGLWGSICSILGIGLAVLALLPSHPSPAPNTTVADSSSVTMKFQGDDFFLSNQGNDTVTNVRLFAVLYTFDRTLKIANRNTTPNTPFACAQLVPNETVLIPKTNYMDKARFRSVWSSDPSAPNPLMLFVLSFRAEGQIKEFYRMEPAVVVTDSMIFPMSYIGQHMPQGYLGFYLPMIKDMKEYERTFSIIE
jgi:hypothetical protein